MRPFEMELKLRGRLCIKYVWFSFGRFAAILYRNEIGIQYRCTEYCQSTLSLNYMHTKLNLVLQKALPYKETLHCVSQTYHGRITDVSRTYHRRITDISNTYHRRMTDVSQTYHRRITDVSQTYYWCRYFGAPVYKSRVDRWLRTALTFCRTIIAIFTS